MPTTAPRRSRPWWAAAVVMAFGMLSTVVRAAPPAPRVENIVLAPAQPFSTDPAVIWYDDFDGPDSVQEKYMEPKPGSRDDRRTDSQALGGAGKSFECFYAKGQQGVGNRKLVFGDSPAGRPVRRGEVFNEIYWRVYVRHGHGWVGNPDKLSRATSLTSDRWAQAFILHVWSSGPVLTLDPATGVAGGEVVTTRYNDFPKLKWLGNKPNGQFPLHTTEEAGRWVCVEAHLKLNTPGQKDGTADLWVDGVIDSRRTGMDYRGTYTGHAINAVFLEAYWNASSPQDQSRWYDDFVVSTKPIGPLVATANPTLFKTPSTAAAWEVELAADSAGRDVVWQSHPAAVGEPAARLTATAQTGTFAGTAAGRTALVPGGGYFCRCRERAQDGDWSAWSPWHQPFAVAAAK